MTQPITMTAIHADAPQPGWYRYRAHREARWEPACIWAEGGKLVCRISNRMVDPCEVWTFLADNRVEKAAAKHCFSTGLWPDEPSPTISNLPADPFDALKAEIEAKTEEAEGLLRQYEAVDSVTDQITCNKMRNLQAQFLDFRRRANALHKGEKDPHVEAGKKVDDKYRFRDAIDDISSKLRARFQAFLRWEEQRLQREAQARYEAEQKRIAAVRARLEAERKKKLADDPVAALTETPLPLPELPSGPEPVKVQAGGLIGRRSGLTTVWTTVVDDYESVAKYFINHPDQRAVLDRLAQHAVRDSKGTLLIPGVTVTEERVAR